MFTSMDIDEKLFHRAWQLSGLKTKRAVVEEALRWMVRLHEQAGVRELRGTLVFEEPEAPKRRRRAGAR